ncbi:MAG: D-erythronate dehydrogenase [Paralcaligenes sp.]
MQILITGGAGLLGSRLAKALLKRNTLADAGGAQQRISRITLLDVVAAKGFDDPRIRVVAGDISNPDTLQAEITPDTQSIFHLAAIVSGEAEANFELGMRINLEATHLILERARQNGNRPRIVFTSSVAAFGGALPAQVLDTTPTTPQSSYGTQKVMGELLISDYSRKHFIDGRALRMPTVCVRPGAPNKAASSFASGIIREPLNGIEAVCPVAPGTALWLVSPAKAIANLIHGHDVDSQWLGASRALNLPGLSTNVGEMVQALERAGGAACAQRVRWQIDPTIERIVNSWPGDFLTTRADAMGFIHDANFDAIVQGYIEELKAEK